MSRGCVRGAALVRALTVAFLSISFSAAVSAASDADTGTIRGVVLDTLGGAPVDKVLVRLQDSGRAVTTDDAGRFEIDQVAAGSHELSVSAVDFILVKQTLTGPDEFDFQLYLRIGEPPYKELVHVTYRRVK